MDDKRTENHSSSGEGKAKEEKKDDFGLFQEMEFP